MGEASRNNESKPPLDYILTFPDALRAFAMVCKHGEKRYAKFNYTKSNKPLLAEYTACALRHLLAWAEGKDLDEDSGQPHLAHALWNLLALCQFALDKTGIDDRPKRPATEYLEAWQRLASSPSALSMKEINESAVDFLDWISKEKPEIWAAIKKEWPDSDPPSVTDQILDNLAQGKEDLRESVGKIVPRYDAGFTDKYNWVELEDGKILLSLYDLGSYEMSKPDFESRESSQIWASKAKAEKAIDGMVLRNWARRVD